MTGRRSCGPPPMSGSSPPARHSRTFSAWERPRAAEAAAATGFLMRIGRIAGCAGAGALLALVLAWIPAATAAAPSRFQKKECLDCHSAFASKYLTLKNQHPGVKTGQCETCHLRHGLVPKLLLKKDGNQLCYDCHGKGTI